MKRILFTTTLALSASLAHGALTWTGGGDGISLYQEANWLEDDGSALEANEINPNTVVGADTGGLISITSGTGSPSNYGGTFVLPGGVDLTVANGKVLAGAPLTGGGAGSVLTLSSGASLGTGGTEFQDIFIDNATADLIGAAGIAMVAGPSAFTLTNGASLITQFVTLGASITVDGTSSIQFLGGGDPINSQAGGLGSTSVDLATGGQLTMVNAAEIDEAIGQNEIFVNGTQVTAANRDSLLSIVGGTGTAIPEPGTSLIGALGLLALLRRRR